MHFIFSVGMLILFVKSSRSIFKKFTTVDTELWVWAIVTTVIFTPVAWVRTVEKFKIGYIYAVCMIALMIVVVIAFCSIRINEQGNEAGPDWERLNEAEFILMIGMAFGQYEGIGAVLPIMEASDAKPIFHWLIAGALATLCSFHIFLSELVYYAYGSEVSEPIIIF